MPDNALDINYDVEDTIPPESRLENGIHYLLVTGRDGNEIPVRLTVINRQPANAETPCISAEGKNGFQKNLGVMFHFAGENNLVVHEFIEITEKEFDELAQEFRRSLINFNYNERLDLSFHAGN